MGDTYWGGSNDTHEKDESKSKGELHIAIRTAGECLVGVLKCHWSVYFIVIFATNSLETPD